MTTYTTQYGKGREGYEAETIIELGPELDHFGRPGTRVLNISTHKSSRGVLTTARAYIRTSDGLMSTDVFGDYQKTLALHKNRCTENFVRSQHEQALAYQAREVIAEAKARYGIAEAELA